MSSVVLELQNELLKPNCDILNALRKAHIIASELSLTEFDGWIQSELNGYKCDETDIQEYRYITCSLKSGIRGVVERNDKHHPETHSTAQIYRKLKEAKSNCIRGFIILLVFFCRKAGYKYGKK